MHANLIRYIAPAVVGLLCAGPIQAAELRDAHFGEALFYAFQEQHFEALERLDTEIAQHYGVDEPQLDSLHQHIGRAEFSVGDFELDYRMHQRAGRAIQAVLEGDVSDEVRNEAAFRLATIHFQKDQPHEALSALESIRGRVPQPIRDDVEFLRANLYMATDQPAEAVAVLRKLEGSKSVRGFSTYNLGIALLRAGEQQDAIDALDRAGRAAARDPETLAIRDKSNLVLGTVLFESEEFSTAQQSLDRVRLEGPFSNQALLRAGWSDASAENFERALVPWGILAERETTDAAVQEAILALPYAYSKLDVHGRAAHLYGRAVETFGRELEHLDASIVSIREGEFLEALAREEIRHDRDWVIRLRSLPEAPETFYLMQLMASHDFQTALQNYLDLEDLRKRLASWQRSFDSFDDLVQLREKYYEPRLPEMDARFRKLDARVRLRLEQRERLDRRLQQLLVAPQPELLATNQELVWSARVDRLAAALGADGDPEIRARIERLKGVIAWTQRTQYHERLTEAHAHLRELNRDVDELNTRYEAFVRARQAATHSYVGYDERIGRLRARVKRAQDEVNTLMTRQGRLLERVAIAELAARRERLAHYHNQARFAFADSYDRATKAQAMAH